MKINSPKLWYDHLPIIKEEHNKYDRGHAIVMGANISTGSTGATKLAAYAALRSGAGLASIICNEETAKIYAASMMSVMIKTDHDLLKDPRVKSILIGPGNGVNQQTKQNVLEILKLSKNTVLDADALTVFQDNPQELFDVINSDVVLTPHAGEFKRIFPNLESAIDAAFLSRATVILKGHDTIIVSPKGEYIVNKSAPTSLATAGSGDVLAGLITGFMAQGVSGFTSCCMASYIHSEAARSFGPGLISEDLIDGIPKVLSHLIKSN